MKTLLTRLLFYFSILTAPALLWGQSQFVFWTEDAQGRVRTANSGGTGVTNIVSGLSTPRGLALDIPSSQVYFTEDGNSDVRRININGTGNTLLVDNGGSNVRGMDIDLVNGKIYWVSFGDGIIHQANLDGSGAVDLITGRDVPADIKVDLVNNHIYWGEVGSTNSIFRANLDGTGITTVLGAVDVLTPNFLSLDTTNDKIYWSTAGANSIRRADLAGTNVETVTTITGQTEGVSIHVATQTVYFGDSSNGIIHQVAAGGGTATNFITGLGAIHELEVIPEPSTYALIFGGVVLGLTVFWRKFKKSA